MKLFVNKFDLRLSLNVFIVSDENSKLGIIDDKDKIKVEIENESLQKVQNTDMIQTVTAKDKTTRIYSRNMEKICEMQNAKVEIIGDFISIFSESEKKFFNKEGKEVDKTEVYSSNTLFSKFKDGKWGFTDKNGNMIVEEKYDKVTEFNEYGFASVQKDGKWGSIDKEGKEVVEPTYTLNDNQEPFFIGSYYQVKYGFGEVYFTDNKN